VLGEGKRRGVKRNHRLPGVALLASAQQCPYLSAMSMRTQVRPFATSFGEAASVGAIGDRILADGESSWKGWLAELVDDFRRQPEMTLIASPPPAALPARIRCLLAATVEALCAERGWPAPAWCAAVAPLPTPWFVAGMENLKASALVESPVFFRQRNVFVLGNFLSRI